MTRQSDIERLAKFMGWNNLTHSEYPHRQSWPSGCFRRGGLSRDGSWYYDEGPIQIPDDCDDGYRIWEPFTRLDDAMMVAEKIGGLTLRHQRGRGYDAWFEGMVCTDDQKSPAEAIALAALAYLDAVGFR